MSNRQTASLCSVARSQRALHAPPARGSQPRSRSWANSEAELRSTLRMRRMPVRHPSETLLAEARAQRKGAPEMPLQQSGLRRLKARDAVAPQRQNPETNKEQRSAQN